MINKFILKKKSSGKSEKPKPNEEKKPEKKEKSIRSRFDKKKKDTEKKKYFTRIIGDHLEKAGFDIDPRNVRKNIIIYSIILSAILSILIITIGIVNDVRIIVVILILLGIWTLCLFAFYALLAWIYCLMLDIKIYQRTKQIEEVLPDFLQLASANISAGMPIDRALWFAVRPKFGVLAGEIEEIAKATTAGEDLDKALINFSRKYDSKVLRESISLIVAGIKAGGELSELLNKISQNIQETKLMKKEIAANVTTYVIFIGIATVVAAPVLFALSTELLGVVKTITSQLEFDTGTAGQGFFSFDFSGDSISQENFMTFAIIVIIISSFFSASIISTIRKGTIKEGLKTIPFFIVVGLLIYFIALGLFSYALSGVF